MKHDVIENNIAHLVSLFDDIRMCNLEHPFFEHLYGGVCGALSTDLGGE